MPSPASAHLARPEAERPAARPSIWPTDTRAQAVLDGFQVEATKTAQEARIRFPVFLTCTVFDAYVTVPEGVTGQDEAGRLWDIVWMLRFAIRKTAQGQDRLPFALYVRNEDRRPKLVKLVAGCPTRIDRSAKNRAPLFGGAFLFWGFALFPNPAARGMASGRIIFSAS